MPIEPVKKKSVVDKIVEQIRDLILKGELQPGDKIDTERKLAEKFGVGRPSIREAIKVLSSIGLVVRENNGTYISSDIVQIIKEPMICNLLLNQNDVHEIFEARKIIEVNCIKLCISRITEEELTSLEDQLEYMYKVKDDAQKLTEADVEFHLAIAEASNNKVLVTFLKTLRGIMKISTIKLLQKSEMAAVAVDYHVKIVDALKKKDEALAVRHMEEHLENARQNLNLSGD